MSARAVLLDALGTLVRLEPPAPRLRAELLEATGKDVGADAAERAFRAEIAYYLAHHLEGRDRASLEALRDRCAKVVSAELGKELQLDAADVREAMLRALDFVPYPDAGPALDALRAQGLRLVVVSNWDCSLPEVLDRAGLRDRVDAVVPSATVGHAKPARQVFEQALRVAGAAPAEAIHAGDSVENDLRGARAAGVRGVLVARDGPPPPGVPAIASLAELTSLT